jgi:hypothetical protein
LARETGRLTAIFDTFSTTNQYNLIVFSFDSISIDFRTATPVLVALALLVLIGLTVFLYRRTNPPVPVWLRLVLGGLRVVAVLALIGSLLEPVIGYTKSDERRPRVAVLADFSSSMDREEQGMTRAQRLDSLLQSPAYRAFENSAVIEPYFFAGELSAFRNDLTRDRTALGEAIYHLEQEQMARPADYWLVFSDGKSNTGRRPQEVAKAFPIPIETIDLATDVGNFDLRLADIDFSPVLFVGQKTTLTPRISWHNAEGKTALVELREKKRVLAQARFPISEESGFGDVVLEYTPEEPGQKLLEAAIVPLEGEESADNNSRSISVKVLKSRLSILLVTARPDYEVGFLRRYFEQSDKYEVELVATGARSGNLAGRFPQQQAELNRYDLVVLYDPDPQEFENRREILHSYLADKGGALWVMLGPRFAQRGPVEWFNQLLPFSQSRRQEALAAEFAAEPAEGNLFHPAVRLADDRAAIRDRWAKQPPFRMIVLCDQTVDDSTVLAYTPPIFGNQRWPVLGYRRVGPGKVIASTALPFWNWRFVTVGLGDDPAAYNALVEGTASWLTITDDFDPVRIVPEKLVFTRGEAVRFDGYANDLGFRPLPDVSGEVTLTDKSGETFEADMSELAPGRLRATLNQLSPGTYDFRASLEQGGRELKTVTGSIQVESYSLEEFDQSGDPATLQALARLSGGTYYTFREFDAALAAMNLNPIKEIESGEFTLWGNLWLLLVFVAALSVEWLLRKLNHLV